VVESTGTGGRMKIFCEGIGEDKADITGASREMDNPNMTTASRKASRMLPRSCSAMTAFRSRSQKKGPDFTISKEQIYLALGKEVPVDGKLVSNPYKNWSDVDMSLPAEPILVYGPPVNS
jgi:phosphate transport system substrate-binding protein